MPSVAAHQTVHIRRPARRELTSVQELVQGVVDETYGGLWAEPPLSVTGDWTCAWVATHGEALLGVLLTEGEWIEDLWIATEHQGRGVGQQLLAFGEHEIAQRRYREAHLRVVQSNRHAIDFYVRRGWAQLREFPHEHLPVTMVELTKHVAATQPQASTSFRGDQP